MKYLNQLKFNSFFILIILSDIFLFYSCATGPEQKEKTFLESLNGKHYDNAHIVSPTSVSASMDQLIFRHRRRANVVIEGKILSVDELNMPIPVTNTLISLYQENNEISITRTDAGGHFRFIGDFADGQTVIRLNSKKYTAEQKFDLKGFEMTHIQLNARRVN